MTWFRFRSRWRNDNDGFLFALKELLSRTRPGQSRRSRSSVALVAAELCESRVLLSAAVAPTIAPEIVAAFEFSIPDATRQVHAPNLVAESPGDAEPDAALRTFNDSRQFGNTTGSPISFQLDTPSGLHLQADGHLQSGGVTTSVVPSTGQGLRWQNAIVISPGHKRGGSSLVGLAMPVAASGRSWQPVPASSEVVAGITVMETSATNSRPAVALPVTFDSSVDVTSIDRGRSFQTRAALHSRGTTTQTLTSHTSTAAFRRSSTAAGLPAPDNQASQPYQQAATETLISERTVEFEVVGLGDYPESMGADESSSRHRSRTVRHVDSHDAEPSRARNSKLTLDLTDILSADDIADSEIIRSEEATADELESAVRTADPQLVFAPHDPGTQTNLAERMRQVRKHSIHAAATDAVADAADYYEIPPPDVTPAEAFEQASLEIAGPRGPPRGPPVSAMTWVRNSGGSQQLLFLRYSIAPRGPTAPSL